MKERLKEIRLVVSDIDGTLLTADNGLPEKSMQAVQAFNTSQMQCRFTLSTGRAYPLIAPFVNLLQLCSPYIFSGGVIYNLEQSKPMPAYYLSHDLIADIARIAEKDGVGLIAHTTKKMLCQLGDADWKAIKSIEWLKGKVVNHASRVHDLHDKPKRKIIRIDVFSETRELKPMYERLSIEFPELHIVLMNRSIEITPPGVNKGSALKKLASLLGIRTAQVLALGDSMNDIAMLKEAGVGVAMGSAPAPLKKIADIIVPSSDEGGFADALALLQKYLKI